MHLMAIAIYYCEEVLISAKTTDVRVMFGIEEGKKPKMLKENFNSKLYQCLKLDDSFFLFCLSAALCNALCVI